MELQQELAKLGKARGLCQEWHDELLGTSDKERMCDMYLRGIDFCLSRDFPDNDFIKERFGETATRKGVYVDRKIDVANRRKCVCLGRTSGLVEVSGYSVSEIFLKHDSNINVTAKDNAFVVIDIFNNATVRVVAQGKARVCVNHYGGYIVRDAKDNAVIKILEKDKPNY